MRGRLAAGIGVTLAFALCAPALATAQDYCFGTLPGDSPTPEPAGAPLRFSIYPGGSAGSALPIRPPATPDQPSKTLAALDLLKPASSQFNAHLYGQYSGDSATDARMLSRMTEQVHFYSSAGYPADLAVRYRPTTGTPEGFAAYMRQVVDALGGAGLQALQVTNEANFTAAPDSADGAYPGVRQALVDGVIAADDEARLKGVDLEVGFNWFYRTNPGDEEGFWTEIGRLGGQPFRDALDWVGVDAYPGTFFPPADPSNGRDTMINALSVLRDCFMGLAGLSDSVAIHVAENGYPTDLAARTPETQNSYLEAMVRTTSELRGNYGVTAYNWFDLRDADSSSPDFQQHYGLLNSDYTQKPAFATYCSLIAELSGDPGGCAASAPGPVGLRWGRCANTFTGTNGADRLDGSARGDRIFGLRGADVLRGMAGNDCLWGQRGPDVLKGNPGDDLLRSSAGADYVNPGPGSDVVLAGLGADRIYSADGERDLIRCGKGFDRVKADRFDRLRGCERVRRVG